MADNVVYKAQPVDGRAVPDLDLRATEPVPGLNCEWESYPAPALALYEEQGKTISAALLASLPGATVDALLVALLEHKRSQLMVAYG